jgi:hypothetical protein
MKNFYLLYQPYTDTACKFVEQTSPQAVEKTEKVITQQVVEHTEGVITQQVVEQIQNDLFSDDIRDNDIRDR